MKLLGEAEPKCGTWGGVAGKHLTVELDCPAGMVAHDLK
jgi:hypothetical protein